MHILGLVAAEEGH